MQLTEGASPKLKLMPRTAFDIGSSFWAVRVRPAESSRLEIVPSAMRLMVFIGDKARPTEFISPIS
jgi:hypothetical protein